MRIQVAVALLCLAGCEDAGVYAQDIAVADASKAERLVLSKQLGRGGVYGISIAGSGEIDGTATLTWLLDGKPYKTQELSGPISFSWGGDWYADTAVLVYEPKTAKGGSLVVRYTFKTI